MGWEGRGLALVWDAAGGASYTRSLVVGETPLCPRGAGAGSVRGPHSDTQWPTVTCVPWPCSPCPPWHLCLADPWAQVLHSGWDHLFLVIMKKCSTCKLMYILLTVSDDNHRLHCAFLLPSPWKILLLCTGNLGFNEFFLPKC